ncbi:MAG: TonB-dependent receptor [Xanthomonadales bacterium]|nr:TonB-dependent receptor [Xanthomonadales bacterium]
MNTKTRTWFSVVTLVLMMALFPVAYAAETTSSIKGNVYDTSGSPVSGAVVTVEDLRTSVQRQYTTNDAGAFLASRLPVGGPYKVVTAGADSAIVDSISLGEIYNLTIDILAAPTMEEVVVTGEQVNMVVTAAGPAATFSSEEILTAVALNRDIAEVYQIDPRINLDNQDDGFAINCAGKNPRFNSITLDGVSQNDRFGLNDNGYSTAMGMPFPYDGIRQVAVELAPFDVTYGGFSACNINAVTKTGTNEWEGGAYYEFTNQNLRGDTLTVHSRVSDLSTPNYEETNYGANLGGPLVKDRLFFFAAYEKSEKPRFLARGPAGSGNGEVRDWLSQADYDRVDQIARTLYNYDTGGMPGNGSVETEKYMVRLDWNISENHNASLIYNYFDGSQDRDSDGDSYEFEYANHFYVKGAESETTTLILTSQWTDAFSTEIFASTNSMQDSQVTVGPKDMGDHQISYGSNTIYLGADDSRQANSLSTDSDFYKFVGKYLAGNHVITAGYEREELSIFNIFVQHSRGGEWDYYDDSSGNPAYCAGLSAQGRHDDPGCGTSGIDKFELGRASRIYYGSGGGTNIATDAAAIFQNNQNALYIQDELYFPANDLSLVYGLRYEWFDSNDAPNYNATFTAANGGLRNDYTIDGVDILQPRLGFTWGVTDDFQLRGGLGLYSGGNPNVWISNSYSNDGLTNAQTSLRNYSVNSIFDGTLPLTGAPGASPPVELYDWVASITPEDASDSNLALIDPNFKQPSDWKLALGFTWDMPGDIQMDVDWLHSRAVDPAMYVDLSQSIVGYTKVGFPIYDYTNGESNFMLTNSSFHADSDTFSIVLSKYFDNGLDLTLGYAYTDSEDVSPMTSSVAQSNFENNGVTDINNPTPATTNYEVPHRFTLRASYSHNFFGDYESRIALYGYSKQGQPQSFIMGRNNFEGNGYYGRHLLYVPTGESDPNVVFGSGFDTDAFFAWIERNGLKPGIQERNADHAKWSTRFDLYLSQEIPTFIGDTRARFYVKVYNLGNLINDSWGVVNDAEFFTVPAVRAHADDEGNIVYDRFDGGSLSYVRENRSLWDVRLGIEFNF